MPNDDDRSRMGHKEAVRLEWLSRRVPIGSLLVSLAAAAILASAVITILSQGPANPMP